MKKITRAAIVVITLLFTLFLSSCFNFKKIELLPRKNNEIKYVNRQQINKRSDLLAVAGEKDNFFRFNLVNNDFLEADTTPVADEAQERDYIGTNTQVDNVDEADVIKTDGNSIYYLANNYLYNFNVLNDGTIEIKNNVYFKNSYVSDLFLTDDYVIVIGTDYNYNNTFLPTIFNYYHYTINGFINVYQKDTLKLEYKLALDNTITHYRLIDNNLFFVHNHRIVENELLPNFKETFNNKTTNYTISYQSVYYFNKLEDTNMTLFSCLNLETFDLFSEAYIGYIQNIYMNETSLYTITPYYDQETAEYNTKIIKFSFDLEESEFNYIGYGVVPGYVQNSYWLDEYDNNLRVVSSIWSPITNYLHILKEDKKTDSLVIIGKITEGLGKPNETIKSVRFDQDKGYVVTFEQVDPLFTIDLIDPTNPEIINATEEPGFSTYLHVWDDLGHLIGIGLDANEIGITKGLKISAYSNSSEEPLETYLLSDDNNNNFTSSEALYNPKAIMIDPTIGIIGFTVNGYSYDQESKTYYYSSDYYIFYIDFDAENIISKPTIIKHSDYESFITVDRGIYIKGQDFEVIYTFSRNLVVSYDLALNEEKQTLNLK